MLAVFNKDPHLPPPPLVKNVLYLFKYINIISYNVEDTYLIKHKIIIQKNEY